MSSHRVQAKNMKISKNPNIFEFRSFIHVRRLCSPKIMFLAWREPFEHWCAKCEILKFCIIMEFWTHFGDSWWNYWQNFMGFWRFFDFLPTLDGSISMTTEPISKSLGIFNMYSLRAVDCAVFCRRAKKMIFRFSRWKIGILRFWLCHPQHC